MRKLWLGIVGLAAASTANAAVITYTLSLHDNGLGVATAPVDGLHTFAVYAEATADNGGIFSAAVDLVDPANAALPPTNANFGKANLVAAQNLMPQYFFRKTTIPTANRYAGFYSGFVQDAETGKLSGLPDLSKGTELLPWYGFGLEGGDMEALPPGGQRPAGFGTATNQNPNADPTTPPYDQTRFYKGKFLVGLGFWTTEQISDGAGGFLPRASGAPMFQVGSVDNKGSVYDDRTGTENVIAAVVLRTQDLITPPPGVSAALNGETKGQNQAVGGAIAVTGSNGSYVSEVDQLLSPSVTVGNAPIQTIGDETGNVYVMAKLTGSATDIAALLGTLTTDVDSSDGEFAKLHGAYDSQFGDGGFNALFKFANVAGPKTFNFDFTANNVSVDQLAAVPEPTTISLLSIAGLGLIARRRRNA